MKDKHRFLLLACLLISCLLTGLLISSSFLQLENAFDHGLPATLTHHTTTLPILYDQHNNVIFLMVFLLAMLAAGYLADRLGRKQIVLFAHVFCLCALPLCIFHPYQLIWQFIALLIFFIAAGALMVATPCYLVEMIPCEWRNKALATFELCFCCAVIVNNMFHCFLPEKNTAIMVFCLLFFISLVCVLLLIPLPKSAFYLLRSGRQQQALQSLNRLHKKSSNFANYFTVKPIVNQQCQWRYLFRKPMARVVLWVVIFSVLNQLTGANLLLQFSPSIFHAEGMISIHDLHVSILLLSLTKCLGVVIGLFFIDRIPHKRLLAISMAGLLLSYALLSVLSVLFLGTAVAYFVNISRAFTVIFFYGMGPGIITWIIVCVFFPTHLRAKGIALGLMSHILARLAYSSVFPLINLHVGIQGVYWLCAAFALLFFIFCVEYLPETNGKKLLDIHFDKT